MGYCDSQFHTAGSVFHVMCQSLWNFANLFCAKLVFAQSILQHLFFHTCQTVCVSNLLQLCVFTFRRYLSQNTVFKVFVFHSCCLYYPAHLNAPSRSCAWSVRGGDHISILYCFDCLGRYQPRNKQKTPLKTELSLYRTQMGDYIVSWKYPYMNKV